MISSNSPLLPVYQRYTGTLPSSRRGLFRMREKYFIVLAAIVIICICFSGFMFLPDGPDPAGAIMRKALKEAWKVDPKQLLVPPPKRESESQTGTDSPVTKGKKMLVHEDDVESDPHRLADKQRLMEKINRDQQIPKPVQEDDQKKLMPVVSSGAGPLDTLAPSQDEENEKRRETVKQMMILAWDSYAKYSWGANELRPISKVGHSASIFGASAIGASIIDALDTLYIMGLLDRYESGRKWVELSLNLDDIRGDLSVFETNIRFVGGLLSIYALTKDEMFARRAAEVADMLLPAFDTPTGIPYALINVRTKSGKNWGWASGGSSILSEIGTLHLEFEYLSIITGQPIYKEKVTKIRNFLAEIEKPNGLYPNYLNPKSGLWSGSHTSLGALGDSFYEYLIKSYVITNKRDEQAKEMYDEAMEVVFQKLVQRSKNSLWYVAEYRESHLDHKMDHLACFVGGMFSLHAVNEANSTISKKWMDLAKEIGHTCHESYIRTATHLGPESFRFNHELEAETNNDREKYYILRPEVIETYFYLWRFTKDKKYRDWAWDAVQAIERHCKTENGYSGIRNVYSKDDPGLDDVQQSFFLAETLKYLYLIFSPDNVIPLDKWVFNTEAHPLPVRLVDEDHLIKSFKPVHRESNNASAPAATELVTELYQE